MQTTTQGLAPRPATCFFAELAGLEGPAPEFRRFRVHVTPAAGVPYGYIAICQTSLDALGMAQALSAEANAGQPVRIRVVPQAVL